MAQQAHIVSVAVLVKLRLMVTAGQSVRHYY